MTKTDDKKGVLINFSLSQDFLELIDTWAEETKSNRSEFIRTSVRHYTQYLKSKSDKNTS